MNSIQSILITLMMMVMMMSMVIVSNEIQWNVCNHYEDFSIAENTKYISRQSLNEQQFHRFTMIDAVNSMNALKNQTYRTKAECTQINVPLDHSSPQNSETIKLFVKRLRADSTKNAPRALWLLAGGPGEASNCFDLDMDLLVKMLDDQFDIYTTDHRGVGRSSRVTCVATQAETPGSDEGVFISDKEWTKNGCAQAFENEWSGKTHLFSSKQAGIDMVQLIQSINIPQNQQVFVMGQSYGTVWVSRMIRYLELTGNPNLISGYIMDGVVSTIGKPAPMGMNENEKIGSLVFNLFDEDFTAVGNALMQLCGGNFSGIATSQFVADGRDTSILQNKQLYSNFRNECKEKFEKVLKNGGDLTSYMHRVLRSVYVNETCRPISEGISLFEWKGIFTHLISNQYGRMLIPAIFYRMDRCDEYVDIPFLLHIKKIFMPTQSLTQQVPLRSLVLGYNIAFSEMWDSNVKLEQLMNEWNSSEILMGGIGVNFASRLNVTQWPTYTPDADYFQQKFTTNIPLLMLNGNLDPNTPLWSALSQNASMGGNSHDLVIIPFSVHCTLESSPTVAESFIPVGMQLLVNFITMEQPNVFLMNRTCLDEINFNFTGSYFYNQRVFGVYNLYEDSYISDSNVPYVSLYLMVGIFIAILVVAVIIANTLIYCIVKMRDEQRLRIENSRVEGIPVVPSSLRAGSSSYQSVSEN
ncbi:hypothetical protein C9374_003985 [Naegleria lovaniensis]|uniref:Peptidase S33 tripeptidyl aminopeptidase-like C-terminal domain-containing protein n=1 Tax=Naegleria lovaniensis TaxID=51637 RepID=A0AA88KSL3_NAELO|nr:uncharacterized protein C9374_003985 [Naegleria lovaniensis]KAG2394221.1 hypothetical protein C9374_003985 [Naegleria lovaniensis]